MPAIPEYSGNLITNVEGLTSGKKYNLKFYWNAWRVPADSDGCSIQVTAAGQAVGTISRSDWMAGGGYHLFTADFTPSTTSGDISLVWTCTSPQSGWTADFWFDDFSICDAPSSPSNPGGDPGSSCTNLIDNPGLELANDGAHAWSGTGNLKFGLQAEQPAASDPLAWDGRQFLYVK